MAYVKSCNFQSYHILWRDVNKNFFFSFILLSQASRFENRSQTINALSTAPVRISTPIKSASLMQDDSYVCCILVFFLIKIEFHSGAPRGSIN